jgi:argininosuccinate lyase
VLIGRLSGFLAVVKSPSARSDNFIFAYGEVPRALDLSLRVTALMSGVIRTLKVHPERMREQLVRGYAQSTDLAEHLTQVCHVDYRSAYQVVGDVVRAASRDGIPGTALTAAMVNAAARARTGREWAVTDADLAPVLDPVQIVASRRALGGAAAEPIAQMLAMTSADADELAAEAELRRHAFRAAERALVARARAVADQPAGASRPTPPERRGTSNHERRTPRSDP